MIRIFLTGDNHIGLKYAGYAQGQKLAEYRKSTLKTMVQAANDASCDLFAVAGDLFHASRGISGQDVTEVVDLLAAFEGQVLVLPGNHDCRAGSRDGAKTVWDCFEEAAAAKGNILLTDEYRPYDLQVGDEPVTVYPAPCQTKNSQPGENNLGWIRRENIRPDRTVRIGLAHGAVEGQTIDSEGSYFLMTRQELEDIPVDVWLIGHTHVPFPSLPVDAYQEGERIFNAGTHVQTDVSCATEGNCFLIEVESGDGLKKVRARRYVSGPIRFFRRRAAVTAGESLAGALDRELGPLPDESVVDLSLSGPVSEEDYQNRARTIEDALARFLDRKTVDDSGLAPIITAERVKREYAETSFSAQLLLRLLDSPKEAQLVYDLLKECE